MKKWTDGMYVGSLHMNVNIGNKMDSVENIFLVMNVKIYKIKK